MVKKRVHEVAKELDLESKELMRQLTRMGVETKSHMSTLDDADIVRLTNHYKAQNVKPATANRPVNNNRPAPPKPRDGADAGRQGATRTSRENQRDAQNRNDRGPGLVDRVPSRPPDRRFTEKPMRYNAGKGVPPRKNSADIQVKPVSQKQPQSPSNEQPKQVPQENQPMPQERQPAAVRPETKSGERRDNRDNRPRPAEHTQNNRTGATDSRPQRPQYEHGRKDGRPPMGAPAPRGTGTSNYQGGAPGPRSGAPVPPRGGAPSPRGGAPGPRGGSAPGPRGGAPTPRSGAPGPRGGDAAKIKLAEKAKPDKVKALEKTKAQERVKQVEKQAYKGKVDKKGRFDKRDLSNEKSQAFKRGGQKRRPQQETRQVPVREKKPITIGENITVKNLAERMSISASEIIKRLMALGVMASINQEIDSDTATILANELGFKVHVKMDMEKEAQVVQETEDDPADLRARPCVVTIMGHVDHGKTSLLDSIRESNVTASEAGGITQHIGAYQVEHKGKKITFVDTPGHEAFTAMRARGAKVTDIAILVVAADDGVKAQTVEAINHARAAEVPIIIAVNKIDKPGAEPQKVKRELTEYNLVAEEWGGETIFVEVSAKEKTNINELLEMILLVSEINEFKANPNRAARGTVIEAELDKGRGPVATILVQNGTLKVGDFIIAGVAYGKVRAMVDHAGRRVKKAGPSTPVEVLGFSEVPPAGELFFAVEGEKLGKQVVDERLAKKREVEMKTAAPKVSLDDLFNQIKEGQVKELNI
ncbi:MAG: translation initiation factor IF-2, partial [Desulfotomaculaceae bacterium]